MTAAAAPFRTAGAPVPPGVCPADRAQRHLRRAATAWVAVAVLGQLIFSLYITLVYGGAVVTGDTDRWNHVMPRGYVPGDTAGNAALMTHVLIAVLIMLGGVLQLLPAIRRRVPALHRWVGRAYMTSVMLTSLAGLFLVWTRGAPNRLSQHIAISLNALIILTCAVFAWRAARARDISAHRQWALRTFLAACGVFFFRLGVFFWLMINQGPVGFDPETFSGPFLTALAFGVYVFVPLTVLEGYFAAQQAVGVWGPRAMAVLLVLLALVSAGGVASVTMMLWWPAMR
jgi:uncharacterized membrane protein